VLLVISLASCLPTAAASATEGAKSITFDGAQFRPDIGHKGVIRAILMKGALTYKASGVDINAGDNLVSNIKPMVDITKRSGTLGSIGGFGGLFDVAAAGYEEPILVSGTDGVGTKVMVGYRSFRNYKGINLFFVYRLLMKLESIIRSASTWWQCA
jgi:phosphoribosylamine--glycine ligase / phosphoribosylglycinamide formyltransferase / phosphoribosylformylglycinamidine cyclo-ligase